MESLLIKKKLNIQKMEGKGGWSFVSFENLLNQTKPAFGWLKVKGKIDDFEIKQFRLFSTKKGAFFMPLRAEIRKAIKKEEGDVVNLELYLDQSDLEIPDEINICLEDFPEALKFFNSLTESNRKFYIDYISAAKHDETKVKRINIMIDKLLQKKRLYDN